MTKIQIYLVIFTLVSTILGGVWYHGFLSGVANEKDKANKTTEQRNEVANKRPDDTVTINRLRKGSF